MHDQARIAAELLRFIIVGEHPLDLKLSRFCIAKLDCTGRDSFSHGAKEVGHRIEMLDQAQLFNAPRSFVRDLRDEALQALDATQQTAQASEAPEMDAIPKLPLAVGIADAVLEAERLRRPLDCETAAQELLEAHPESGASHEEVVEALVEETGTPAPRA